MKVQLKSSGRNSAINANNNWCIINNLTLLYSYVYYVTCFSMLKICKEKDQRAFHLKRERPYQRLHHEITSNA